MTVSCWKLRYLPPYLRQCACINLSSFPFFCTLFVDSKFTDLFLDMDLDILRSVSDDFILFFFDGTQRILRQLRPTASFLPLIYL